VADVSGIFPPLRSFCKFSEQIGFSFIGCPWVVKNEGIMNKKKARNDGNSIILMIILNYYIVSAAVSAGRI